MYFSLEAEHGGKKKKIKTIQTHTENVVILRNHAGPALR